MGLTTVNLDVAQNIVSYVVPPSADTACACACDTENWAGKGCFQVAEH